MFEAIRSRGRDRMMEVVLPLLLLATVASLTAGMIEAALETAHNLGPLISRAQRTAPPPVELVLAPPAGEHGLALRMRQADPARLPPTFF